MANLDVSAYNGAISHNNERFLFRAAMQDDAEELARMYAEISVNKGNYHEKLEPGPEDFSKTGGMFIIHDKDSILEEMAKSRSLFGIIQSPDGCAAAMLWVSLDDPAFRTYKDTDNDALIFAREIIVRLNNIPHLTALLFYTVFRTLKTLGYTHSIGEVYKVLEYQDRDGTHHCGMLNERSFRSIMDNGAMHTGKNPVRETVVKSIPLIALIEPQIVYFDYGIVLPTLEKKLEKLGIEIAFEGTNQ